MSLKPVAQQPYRQGIGCEGHQDGGLIFGTALPGGPGMHRGAGRAEQKGQPNE